MENQSSAVVTAVTNMANTVSTDALATITAVLPVAGGVIAAVVAAGLGIKLVRRWFK